MAAVVLWLLGLAVPTGIAAVVALLVFLVVAFGGAGERFGGFGPGYAVAQRPIPGLAQLNFSTSSLTRAQTRE